MKKFYRSKDNSYVAGVCGGLGEYTGIDPIIWRIAAIFSPFGLSIYIITYLFTEKK